MSPRELMDALKGVTAQKTAYSSVVGQSVQLIAADGSCLAIIMISIPRPDLDYRTYADPIADRIAAVFPTAPAAQE